VRNARITLLLLPVAGVVLACDRSAPRLVPEKPLSLADVVTEHCRDCHTRSVSDATPEALAVFDLDDPDWLAGIPSKSFYAFTARLLPHADARIANELRATVDAELARRQR
jgi:hypothetical protein